MTAFFDKKEVLAMMEAVSQKNLAGDTFTVRNALAKAIEKVISRSTEVVAPIKVWVDEEGQVRAWRLFELVDQISNPDTQMLFSEVEGEIVEQGYAYESLNAELSLTRSQILAVKQNCLSLLKKYELQKNLEYLLSSQTNKNNSEHFFDSLTPTATACALFSATITEITPSKIIANVQANTNLSFTSKTSHISPVQVEISKKNLSNPSQISRLRPNDELFFVIDTSDAENFVCTQRTNDFLLAMLRSAVPAIRHEYIQVENIARIPGVKSKVVVTKSLTGNLQATNSARAQAIGPRGSCAKAIVALLGGEFVEFIDSHHDNVEQALACLSCFEVEKVHIDEITQDVTFVVADSQQDLIFKRLIDIELAKELTNLNLIIMTQKDFLEQEQVEKKFFIDKVQKNFNLSAPDANLLYSMGITSVEEVLATTCEFFQNEITSGDITKISEQVKSMVLSIRSGESMSCF